MTKRLLTVPSRVPRGGVDLYAISFGWLAFVSSLYSIFFLSHRQRILILLLLFLVLLMAPVFSYRVLYSQCQVYVSAISFVHQISQTIGEQYRMHEEHRRCVPCNSGGGGGGGAPRPVRRPADLDTDIERVRERGRDPTKRGIEGGAAELTRARACTHGSDSWERRQGRRGCRLATLFAAAAAPPIFRNAGDERERESPT